MKRRKDTKTTPCPRCGDKLDLETVRFLRREGAKDNDIADFECGCVVDWKAGYTWA